MKRALIMILALWIVVGGFVLQVAQAGSEPPEVSGVALNGSSSQNYNFLFVPTLNLTAIIDDSFTGGNITAGANYTVGPANWPGIPMFPTDGSFDNMIEAVNATILNPGIAGSWTYCVYGWDVVPNNNTTSTACAGLTILDDVSPLIASVTLDGLSDLTITSGTASVAVDATLDDSTRGNSNIQNASYSASWGATGPLSIVNPPTSPTEDYTASLLTVSLTPGPYQLCIYGSDSTSNLAGPSCANLTVLSGLDTQPPEVANPLLNGQPFQSYSLSAVPVLILTATVDDNLTGGSNIAGANYTEGAGNWPGTSMIPVDGAFDEIIDDAATSIPNPGIAGNWSFCVYGWDQSGNYNTTSTACAGLIIFDDQSPIISSVTLNGLSSLDIQEGTSSVVLNATLDDSNRGNSNIQNASFLASWGPSGPMTLVNPPVSPTENFTSSGSPASLSPGLYQICVYGADDGGNLAGPSCANLTVLPAPDTQPPEIGSVLLNGVPIITVIHGALVTLTANVDDSSVGNSSVLSANFTVGFKNWTSSTPMIPTDGAFDSPMEDATVTTNTTSWSVGSWMVCINALDSSFNENNTCQDFAILNIAPADIEHPLIENVLVNGADWVDVFAGTVVTVDATLNDTATGNSNILNANYTMGSVNWPGIPMNPTDGSFDGPSEDVISIINTTGWIPGSYEVWVYGCDEQSNCNMIGDFADINIIADSIQPQVGNPLLNGVQGQIYSLSAVPVLILTATIDDNLTGDSKISGANYTEGAGNWPGTPMTAVDGLFDEVTEDVIATIPGPETAGTWTYCVYGWDQAGNFNFTSNACSSLVILDDLPPIITSVSLNGLSGLTIQEGTSSVVLNATLDDSATGSNTGNSNIQNASFVASWGPNGPMTLVNPPASPTEDYTASLSTSGLTLGTYQVCVYGADDDGNLAASSCVFLAVSPGPDEQPPEIWAIAITPTTVPVSSPPPTVQLVATVDDSNTGVSLIDLATYKLNGGPLTIMNALDGAFDEVIETVIASLTTPTVAGQYMICVYGTDSADNTNTTGVCTTLMVVDDVAPIVSFTISPERPTVNEVVTLNASNSSDAHSSVLSYNWTVLDAESNEFTLAGEIVTFPINQDGQYTIVLNLTDEWGNWEIGQRTLTVSSEQPAESVGSSVVGVAGVGIGVVLLLVALLCYRIPSEETVLSRTDKIKPFAISHFRGIRVPRMEESYDEKSREILRRTREELTESVESLEEVGGDE